RARRADVWEAEQVDRAQAQFAQLATEDHQPHRTRVRPNAASRIRARVDAAFMSKDWTAMRALGSEKLVFEDRRHWSQISGGLEMWVKSSESVQVASEVALHDEVIETFGERIELRRRVLTGIGPDGGPFESELILLTEIDADGRIVASMSFDIEARA